MPAKLCELRISDGTSYGSAGNDDSHLYFPKTIINQVVGLLDENGKINPNLIPSFLFGTTKNINTIYFNTTGYALLDMIFDYIDETGLQKNITTLHNIRGSYFQAGDNLTIDLTDSININEGDNPLLYSFFGAKTLMFQAESGDDGDGTSSILNIEKNDFVVFNGVYEASEKIVFVYFSVINNTYADATTTQKGVVNLATEAEIVAGINTTKVVTPAGAKKAVETFGYKHPSINPTIGALGSLKAITNITLSADGNHIASITTADIPTASFEGKGVIKNATTSQAKNSDLTTYNEGYAVSPLVAKEMIDYWGRIEYFQTLADANSSPTKNVSGKLVLVGV